ncbi:MAG TPA: hypothetical protein VM032_06955 [Vicinamibacterales bacterium]|nr:hypothetical protein [Vicinamibacterales bacterium]
MRPAFLRRSAVALAAWFLLLATAASAESVRVTADRSTIWRNSTGTGGVLVVVRSGTVLEVKGRQGRWLIVEHPTDPRQSGFILAQQTEPADAPSRGSDGAAPAPPPQSGRGPAAAGPGTAGRPQPLSRQAPRPRQASSAIRPFLFVGLTVPASSLDFTGVSTTTTLYETETRTTRFGVTRKPGFEIGGGAPVTRRFMLAGVISRRSGDGDAHVSAEIPHPILYGRPRSLSGDFPSPRTETAAHLQLGTLLYHSPRLAVAGALGPSLFVVRQALIEQLHYAESYPYDVITFTGVSVAPSTARSPGFNAQLDVMGRLAPRLSWQISARWNRASLSFDGLPDRVKASWGQVSGGLRYDLD